MKREFICLEGLDGVGKTETAAALARRLGARLLKTPPVELAAVRDSWTLPCAGGINGRYLHFLSGLTITSERVRLLRESTPVVLDRYLASTCCYHLALGATVTLDLNSVGLEKPTHIIFLDCDEEVRRRRLLARGFQTAEDLLTYGELGEKVRERYSSWQMTRVDSTYLSVDEVVLRICALANFDHCDHLSTKDIV
jgi:thymidylate kinase